mgnify:CR=1 FL=1
MSIPKTYKPQELEKSIYEAWLESNYFHAVIKKDTKPFVIVLPPPNLTGILHLGHALNATIQDIFIRWKKLQGYLTEWLPGVDHAGIATQVVVERNLPKGVTRESLGREKFVQLIWDWVKSKKVVILEQLRRIGVACDWARTRFTLDVGFSQAVKEAFIRLHKKGLIYRGDYIVNWCPRCQTALSDEQVKHQEVKGHLYYIRYPLKDGAGYVTVATTRPETMLGDTALAINPEDTRNKKYIGKIAILPFIKRELPIIGDERVDPEFGTGIVKVTPAHDRDDFEIGEKHKLPRVKIMDERGVINENGGKFKGLDRFEARKKIIEELKEKGLLERIEDYTISLGKCERCKSVVEPYLSRQWFVKMKPLAEPGIDAVERGIIKFHPERWKGVFLNWMYNIKDWCISRQIWWGHSIPVYWCDECGKYEVASEKPQKCSYCGSENITPDPDVLDTWFSSWLWPFATFGWPKKTEELEYFYPTDVLVTGPEIIFFWVARMIMAGYEFMGKYPFHDVYIHGTVRDAIGRKMDKSLGNGIDPIEVIEKYGGDAMRFTLVFKSGEGKDPHLKLDTFEIGRNFANKIWNAFRLIKFLEQDEKKDFEEDLADRWILSRLQRIIKTVEDKLEDYKLYEPLSTIYEFFWHEFCDWYLEIVKLTGHLKIAKHVMSEVMKLLHPFMPFITELIYKELNGKSILESRWSSPREALVDSSCAVSYTHLTLPTKA